MASQFSTSSPNGPKIHLVTGKGGVGKSTVAASLAARMAKSGRRTLLVELGEVSYLGPILGIEATYEPKKTSLGFEISLWTGENCLREFIGHYLRIQTLVDIFFNNPVTHSLVQAAPALKELAILGKATSKIRHYGPQLDYDEVILDCYATGHFLAMMRAPKGMAEAVKFGPMGEQSLSILATLKDPNWVKYYVVTFPEEMPLVEGAELAATLKSEFGVAATMICNRWLHTDIQTSDLKSLRDEISAATEGAKSLEEFSTWVFCHLQRQQEAKEFFSEKKINPIYLPFAMDLQALSRISRMSENLEASP